MKTRLELRTSKDPFVVADKLRNVEGVYSSNVIEVNTVVVIYNKRKLKEDELIAHLINRRTA